MDGDARPHRASHELFRLEAEVVVKVLAARFPDYSARLRVGGRLPQGDRDAIGDVIEDLLGRLRLCPVRSFRPESPRCRHRLPRKSRLPRRCKGWERSDRVAFDSSGSDGYRPATIWGQP